MVQEIEMTKEEQMIMYMKCSKKELCEMLIEANKHLKNLPIHVVGVPKGTLCDKCAEIWCITDEEDKKGMSCDCIK